MKKLYGEFNENGYEIFDSEDIGGMPIYQAGNCQHDSSQSLPAGSCGTLDIATIEEYCNTTGAELAKEHGAEWGGCQRTENFDVE